MRNVISSFFKDETVTTTIEYGLIAAAISVAIILVVDIIGLTVNGKFASFLASLCRDSCIIVVPFN
jgi:pilus assembly protein Flp/PilA